MDRPKVTYKKWWHRLIPSYRRSISLMDYMFEEHWKHSGEEELQSHMKEFLLTGKTKIGNKTFYLGEF